MPLTATPTWTGTEIIFTATITNTADIINSATATPPPTLTFTVTPTLFVPSATPTWTITQTITWTLTATRTFTPTLTRTPTQAATATATPQPDGEQIITDVSPVPNPVSWNSITQIRVYFDCLRTDSEKVTLAIYSQGYRLVYKKEYTGSEAWAVLSARHAVIDKASLPVFANGTYFILITAETDGKKAVSNRGKLVILR